MTESKMQPKVGTPHDWISLGWICRSCGTINKSDCHIQWENFAEGAEPRWCVPCTKCDVLYDITLKKTPDSMQITLRKLKSED